MKRLIIVGSILMCLAPPAPAAPQHWGFGFGYLVTLEENAEGQRALSVYEPPLRVKDTPWLLRWRDVAGEFADIVPNGLAVGNFWPQPMGEEQVVLVVRDAEGQLATRVLAVPDVFSTRPWDVIGKPGIVGPYIGGAMADRILATDGGDPLGTGRDHLVQLEPFGAMAGFAQVVIYAPPNSPTEGRWNVVGKVTAPAAGTAVDMAVGDFWGDGRDRVAILSRSGRDWTLTFLDVTAAPSGELVAKELGHETLPSADAGEKLIVGSDFLKDGFAYVGLLANDDDLAFRIAPRREQRYSTVWVRPDETFAGAKLAGQELGQGRQLMAGQRQAAFGKVVSAGAGRVFGFVIPGCDERKETLWKTWDFKGVNDVEISFAHRTPVYRRGVPKKWQDGNWPWEPDDHFGWPHKGEEVTYHVHIKNNGWRPIEPGMLTLRAWINTPDRNADTLPGAGERVGLTWTNEEPIPRFDPDDPKYAVVDVTFPWPYKLVQPPGWTWKRINVREIGERWLILRLEYLDDRNERNDRYEMALDAKLLRPVFRYDDEVNTLAERAPTVAGDPESKEYIARKLADAVQCMWERSRTSSGDDVWQRVAFVGYRLGWPVNREQDWSYYEGPRELQKWLGLWGDFERFNPADGGAELHETGHLFHRIGDLYHYFVFPTSTRRIRMGDGSPVQMYTYAWAPDSYCSGHAIIGEATCDLHRYIEGARYGLGWPWHRMSPEKVHVRVLDRDGEPVPDAPIKLWSFSPAEASVVNSGVTGPDGRWDTGLPGGKRTVFDPFDIPLFEGAIFDALAHVYTVDFDGYSEFGVFGADSVAAHSRYTLMQHSIIDRAEWTWDLHTLYKAGAPQPTFEVTCGVQGRRVVLHIDGAPQSTYRLYRRWEPTYAFEQIDEKTATESAVRFRDDMGTADWFTSGRFRAAYYVTQIADGVESLPKRVYGIAVNNARGVSDIGDGKLLVSVNSGKAEPFVIIADGTTPLEEYIKHYRFGHTAAKIVRSLNNPERFYATLAGSDLPGMERAFDLIQFDKPDRFQKQYPVVQDVATMEVRSFTTKPPYEITLASADAGAATATMVGDFAVNGADHGRKARILEVNDLTLVVDKLIFDAGPADRQWVNVSFGGGAVGNGTTNRQLRAPRGLDVIRVGDVEYVAIADTGNGRVVIWDSQTRYVTDWKTDGLRPAAIARHPQRENEFFVLSRQPGGPAELHLLRFDGQRLRTSKGYPVNVRVGDADDGSEIGLAAAIDPNDDRVVVAITDATTKSVYAMKSDLLRWTTVATFTRARGAYVGGRELVKPTDVAFTLKDDTLSLYAVDGQNRIVQLK